MAINKQYYTILWIIFAMLVMGLLAWGIQPASAVNAQGDLPNRDTPVPTQPGKKKDNSGPKGAHIELFTSGAPVGEWSKVQWQNELGDWYDVEGWQGTLNANGTRRWWVSEKDFGSGPFRWVITQGEVGPIWGISDPFNLPFGANETVPVMVSP